MTHPSVRSAMRDCGYMLLFLGLAALLSLLLDRIPAADNSSSVLLFMLAVLFTSVATASVGWGAVAAILGMICVNYLFTEPRGTMFIHSSSDVIMLAVFLIAGCVTGSVATRLRRQRDRASRGERAAQELMKLREEQEHTRLAMEKERLRGLLLRSVAHDLRSPLTALYGASCLLSEDNEQLQPWERQRLARHMTEEILWLTDMVENILHMTRIGQDGLRPQVSLESVDDLIGEAIRHVRPLLGERRISVSLGEPVVMVPADGRLIVQALVNLLENAVRHTPPKTSISLEAGAVGDELRIAVADQGPGVPEEHRQYIFESFSQLDAGGGDSRSGLGLGLAICKAIVEAHGGRIWVDNNLPRGAMFCFTLPLSAVGDRPSEVDK